MTHNNWLQYAFIFLPPPVGEILVILKPHLYLVIPPLVGILIRYLLKVHHRVTWSFIILNLLSTLSAFAQILLCPISRFLGSGYGRRYVAFSAADSIAIPSVGRSKSISSTFVGVVLIAPAIIVHATLYRSASSDLPKTMSIMSHFATAAYVTLWIITRF